MEIEPNIPTRKGPAEHFTGDAWIDMVAKPRPAPAPAVARLIAGMVRFAPGARTAWHTHALGQTLHVTQGIALVQARGHEAVDEWHWHGATEAATMTHLAMYQSIPENEEPAVAWGAQVTEAEYRTAHQAMEGMRH
jgi:quercetin dioxygenase-like cupin family protein